MTNRKEGFDEFGNPTGKAFDLGGVDDEMLRDEKILLYVGYVDEHYEWQHAKNSVAERNMHMDIVYREKFGHFDIDERTLSRYQQLWMVSDRSLTVSKKNVEMICAFAQNGGGLLLWADNDPYFQDANAVAQTLLKVSLSGNKLGEGIMLPGERLSPGHFIEHPLTSGVNQLYEGHTICTISAAANVTQLAQSHDRQICMACYESDKQRVVLDTAFTKLKPGSFYKTAGTARYFRNIAFWLSRGARNVEYKSFTPGRESLATINPDASSEKYKYQVTQPAKLTYILHWEGSATLNLVIQDPQGRTIHDAPASKAPIRVDVTASMSGNWLCWVKGVQVPKANFPYVLTLVLHKGSSSESPLAVNNAAVTSASTTGVIKRLPIYIVLDGSGRASDFAPNLDLGISVLANRLRSRVGRGSSSSLALLLADEDGHVVVPLTEIERFSLPKLIRRGKCSLGYVLAKLNASIASHPAEGKALVLIFLTGAIDDDWVSQADQLHNLAAQGRANVFVLGVGGYNDATTLKRLTSSTPLSLPVLTQIYAQQTFDWLYQIADVVLSGMEGGGASGSTAIVSTQPTCLKLIL